MPTEPEPERGTELLIPWRTFLKIALALLVGFILLKLRLLAAMLLAAMLIATTLQPLRKWVEGRGGPRWAGVLLCTFLIVFLVGGFVAVLVPTISHQGAGLIEKLPSMRTDFLNQLPQAGGLRETFDRLFGAFSINDPGAILKASMAWGAVALEGLTSFILVLVISIYLMADGEQVYQYLAAFVPKRQRGKVATTAREISEVVRRWITGQAIASLLAALYATIALSILHVPGALLLGIMAGLFDIIPVIGFFCATIPALASAVTVSPTIAVVVLGLYVVYHLLETYLIIPKVFGDRLKLSMLAVLLACLVAYYLAGPLAILFALPLVASYPVIERIWLQPYLESDTVEKHEEIAS